MTPIDSTGFAHRLAPPLEGFRERAFGLIDCGHASSCSFSAMS